MIYLVLSEPCVYMSCYYGNVQGASGAVDFGTGVRNSRAHSPATVLASTEPEHTIGTVVEGWKGKDTSYFDNVSPTDSD